MSEFSYPIYTEPAECRDCYKCLRECPVKAIRIYNNTASIIGEECILCGLCVGLCPAGAKKIRNDVARCRQIVLHGKEVVISLAPTWRSYFDDSLDELGERIKLLGVIAVAETAEGAEVFSRKALSLMAQRDTPAISTACPVSVSAFLRIPEGERPDILPLASPAILHGRLLKERYGADIQVVFVGPCIAKKGESDRNPDSLFAALTFDEFDQWLQFALTDLIIHPSVEEAGKIPFDRGGAGNFFPHEGGICQTMGFIASTPTVSFSGLSTIDELCTFSDSKEGGSVFIEHSACIGSCINGPALRQHGSLLNRKLKSSKKFSSSMKDIFKEKELKFDFSMSKNSVLPPVKPSYEELQVVLLSIGKITTKDEKNCGGCGYSTCRDFVTAVLQNKAERQMCMTWIRQLSEKKTDAILNSMPSGVVIVDSAGIIVESNRAFAKLLGEDAEYAFEASPGLIGMSLKKLVPFVEDFLLVLEEDKGVLERSWKLNNRVVEASLFCLEKMNLAGAVIRDITDPYVRRDRIIQKAQDVLEKNVQTVQQIAFLLGENAAETEVILNSILESFSNDKDSQK